ncbi:MAG: sugar phosphate isomerase/epimerase [Saprospiraceae bacterium]|jgi:sugar phosphate isomerase/epimerase
MKMERRNFLQWAGTVAAGSLVAPQYACKSAAGMSNSKNASIDAYGIQLYTLRDIIPNDPKGTLKEISTYGFKQIEGYDGPQGMFWNMGHKGFKSYLDGLGMQMISSHVDINKNFEEKAGQAAEIGMKYLICPYIGPQKSVDAWKNVTDRFNACGEICRKNGIRFAYHNHAYSFKAFSGMIPHDFMMENTDPELVDHEMDIYWVVTGGADPIEYLKKYPNRFRLCHVKDRMKNAGDEHSASCDLGTGIIDYPKILKVAEEMGMKYYILEQERYDNSTPLKSAKAGAAYLDKLVFA